MPYSIGIRIPEDQLTRLKRNLASPEIRNRYDKRMGQALAGTLRALIEDTPKRKGLLRKGWAAGFARLGPLRYQLTNPMPYAEAVEEGAKPRVIVPKRGKVLAWKSATSFSIKTRKMTGFNMVFAKRVNWPGFPGRFMLKKNLPRISLALRTALLDEIRKVWGGR